MDEDWLLCRLGCYRALRDSRYFLWCCRLLGLAQLLQQLLMDYSAKLLSFTMRCIAILTIVWLYFSFDAARYSFFPQCPFHTLTHLYCPGCGSQRALSALLHGDVRKALSYNVLFVISLPLLVYSAIVYIINVFGRKPVSQKLVYSPFFIQICLWTVVLFFVLRNLPLPLFAYLRPE